MPSSEGSKGSASPGGAVAALLRRHLTGRAAVLVLVLSGLAIALVYPLKQYLAQRSDIGDLQKSTKQQQQDVAQLQADLARWHDPAYVEQQAREGLHYVMPGDTSYVVLNPPAPATPSPSVSPGSPQWYDDMWKSMQGADRKPAPTPTVTGPPATPGPIANTPRPSH